jgi:hypothetical protein
MAQGLIGKRKPYIVCPRQAMAVPIEKPSRTLASTISSWPSRMIPMRRPPRTAYSDRAVCVHCNSDPLSQEAVEFPPRFTALHGVILCDPSDTGAHCRAEILF